MMLRGLSFRIILLLLCLSAALPGEVHASTPIHSRNVTPENIADFKEGFAVKVRQLNHRTWFEVSAKIPEGDLGSWLGIGVEQRQFSAIGAKCWFCVKPSKCHEVWIFRFGLSDTNVANSIFELFFPGEGHHSAYNFKLWTFIQKDAD
jgi:hypothetical protein